jgi:hypothetical protein
MRRCLVSKPRKRKMIEQFMFGTYFIFCLLYSKTTFQWKTKNPNKKVELAAGEFKINIIVSVSIKLGICKIATKTSWMGGKKEKNTMQVIFPEMSKTINCRGYVTKWPPPEVHNLQPSKCNLPQFKSPPRMIW